MERVLGEVAVILRQDRTDEVRMVHDVDVDETAPAHEIPVFAEHLVHTGVRVPGDPPHSIEPRRRRWTAPRAPVWCPRPAGGHFRFLGVSEASESRVFRFEAPA